MGPLSRPCRRLLPRKEVAQIKMSEVQEMHTPKSAPTSARRHVASMLIAGLGMFFLVPPIYTTIADWRGWRNELVWAHVYDLIPCLVAALLCFSCAWRVRHRDI